MQENTEKANSQGDGNTSSIEVANISNENASEVTLNPSSTENTSENATNNTTSSNESNSNNQATYKIFDDGFLDRKFKASDSMLDKVSFHYRKAYGIKGKEPEKNLLRQFLGRMDFKKSKLTNFIKDYYSMQKNTGWIFNYAYGRNVESTGTINKKSTIGVRTNVIKDLAKLPNKWGKKILGIFEKEPLEKLKINKPLFTGAYSFQSTKGDYDNVVDKAKEKQLNIIRPQQVLKRRQLNELRSQRDTEAGNIPRKSLVEIVKVNKELEDLAKSV